MAGLALLIELQQQSQGLAGIGHFDECGAHGLSGLEVLVYKHHAGFCLVEIVLIGRVGHKGEGTLACFFYLGKSADVCVGVAYQGAVNISGYLFRCKFHVTLGNSPFRVMF